MATSDDPRRKAAVAAAVEKLIKLKRERTLTVFGARERPRILVYSRRRGLLEALRKVFKTVEEAPVPSPTPMPWPEQAEFDILVTTEGVPPGVASHLYVVAVGVGSLGMAHLTDEIRGESAAHGLVGFTSGTRAKQFAIQKLLVPQAVAELARTDLVPKLMTRDASLIVLSLFAARPEKILGEHPAVRPIVLTSAGDVVAGSFTREGGRAECWALPVDADVTAWLKLAVETWRERDAARFPPPAVEWSSQPDWYSADETRRASEYVDLQNRNAATRAAMDAEEAAALAAFEAARATADGAARLLLTTQGDPLKFALKRALEGLGFKVVDFDEVTKDGERREDLRVTSPDGPADWEAIVEVRGYAGGAKVTDLGRMHRFALLYVKEKGGREPSAMWFVVNPLLGRDPDERDEVLASHPVEVAEFVAVGGALIDTAALYRLCEAVKAGNVAPADARKLLQGLRGRLQWPPAPSPASAPSAGAARSA